MGSKGSQTVSQQQTYSPNPAIAGAGSQALTAAQNAASQPFQTPAAPVAQFSPDQLRAFQQVRDTQGVAQPYINAGVNYANQSAAPITGSEVANYLNPFAGNVLANLNETFGQQRRNTTGQLTQAAGGVGADRIAVGQSELARQQGLAAGQTLAGLYTPALAAAQQDKQRQANAAYAMGNFGQEALGTNLQGTGALLNTGNQQQAQTQAELNSPYQNTLARLAYPFQTAQYLAGITGSLAPAFGGTTSAQQTYPGPSLLGSIVGAAQTGIGLYNGFGGGSGGGMGKGANTGSGSYSMSPGQTGWSNFGTGGTSYPTFASGGGIDENSVVPDIELKTPEMHYPVLQPMPASGGQGGQGGGGGGNDTMKAIEIGAKLLPMIFAAQGGAVEADVGDGAGLPIEGYALGGPLMGTPFNDRYPSPQEYLGSRDTPTPFTDRYPDQSESLGSLPNLSPMDRVNQGFGAADEAVAEGVMDPQGANQGTQIASAAPGPFVGPMQAPQGQEDATGTGAPLPMARPQIAQADTGAATDAPPPYAGLTPPPYAEARDQMDAGQKFTRSPWAALVRAGLATIAAQNSRDSRGLPAYPLAAIAKGGLEGMKALDEQREEIRKEQTINQQAKQLAQQAQFHQDQYSKLTKAQETELALKQKQLEMENWVAIPGSLPPTMFNKKTGETKTVGEVQSEVSNKTDNPQPEAPLAQTTVSPNGGRVITEPVNKMVETGNVADGARTNPDVLRQYPNAQLRGRGMAEAATEARGMEKQVQAADQNKTRAIEMRHSLDTITNFIREHPDDKVVSTLATPGITGEQRQKILNAMAVLPKYRNDPKFQELVASVNKLGKDSILGGFTNITATGLSAREAQPIIRAGMSAIASFNIPEQSSRILLASMEAASDRVKDMKGFMDAYRTKNGGLALGWREAFDAANPPEKYIARAVYENLPQEKRQALNTHVSELRSYRDALIGAEKTGDVAAANQARTNYLTAKRAFDSQYGNLGNYFAFGKF